MAKQGQNGAQCEKMVKIVKTDQKWPDLSQNSKKWHKMTKNCQKWSKMTRKLFSTKSHFYFKTLTF